MVAISCSASGYCSVPNRARIVSSRINIWGDYLINALRVPLKSPGGQPGCSPRHRVNRHPRESRVRLAIVPSTEVLLQPYVKDDEQVAAAHFPQLELRL